MILQTVHFLIPAWLPLQLHNRFTLGNRRKGQAVQRIACVQHEDRRARRLQRLFGIGHAGKAQIVVYPAVRIIGMQNEIDTTISYLAENLETEITKVANALFNDKEITLDLAYESVNEELSLSDGEE